MSRALRCLGIAAVLSLGGCNGINLGDNPGPDVAKQRGPLTIPPAIAKGPTPE